MINASILYCRLSLQTALIIDLHVHVREYVKWLVRWLACRSWKFYMVLAGVWMFVRAITTLVHQNLSRNPLSWLLRIVDNTSSNDYTVHWLFSANSVHVYMTVLTTGGISLDKNLDEKATSFYGMCIIRLCKDVLRIAHIQCWYYVVAVGSLFSRNEVQRVAEKRRGEISDYCNRLVTLPPKVAEYPKLLQFFELRDDDLNIPGESK